MMASPAAAPARSGPAVQPPPLAPAVAAPVSAPYDATSVSKICFNAHCKEPKPDGGVRRRGWRLRSGEYADLCDRCYLPFEQGNFCETFHSDIPGWRNCETCGKRLHCGCIVSVYAYVLLDAGGVDCYMCSRRSHVPAPSHLWSSPQHVSQQVVERKDSCGKSWRPPPAGQFPGHWRQTNLWSLSSVHSDLQQRLALEFDRPPGENKLLPGRTYIHAPEKKFDDLHDRITSNNMANVRDRYVNGHPGLEPSHPNFPYVSLYHREGGSQSGLHEPSHQYSEVDPFSPGRGAPSDHCSGRLARISFDSRPNSSLPQAISKHETSSMPAGLAVPLQSPNAPKELASIAPHHQHGLLTSASMPRQYSQNALDCELQSQMRSARPRMDAKSRSQLLPRYWPRTTNQELQQISGDSNSIITPLFEKILSASDAGKIGRLVLPKKCAEAYFPPISHAEGLPLKVHDANGKEWIFQFRFWPNNNSRMYVLEGVTPCIQSMQLQAGDTVTFSRTDPDGRLIMGFRKASNLHSLEQDLPQTKCANGLAPSLEANNTSHIAEPSINTFTPPQPSLSNVELKSSSGPSDLLVCPKIEKVDSPQKDFSVRPSLGVGRKRGSSLGPKVRRLRIEHNESLELRLKWEEAQELLRPAPNKLPSVVVVEGHEFEEYEEPPVVGRKSHYMSNQEGESYLWVKCEDCSKWRKLPAHVLLPLIWTCSDNKWDPERSSCSSAQELTEEQIAEITSPRKGTMKRCKLAVSKVESVEVSDGLDTLANLAILGEDDDCNASKATTTRHPRHRPGCSCIVCIQPPSGKGPKHKQTCTCNVCVTVKRRFKTLMMRREKRQTGKHETARKKAEQPSHSDEDSPQSSSPQKASAEAEDDMTDEVSDAGKTSSPVKNHIDLNMHPEREEEQSSPKSDAVAKDAVQ